MIKFTLEASLNFGLDARFCDDMFWNSNILMKSFVYCNYLGIGRSFLANCGFRKGMCHISTKISSISFFKLLGIIDWMWFTNTIQMFCDTFCTPTATEFDRRPILRVITRWQFKTNPTSDECNLKILWCTYILIDLA